MQNLEQHNCFQIDEHLEEQTCLYTCILQDANKIDIFVFIKQQVKNYFFKVRGRFSNMMLLVMRFKKASYIKKMS